MLDHVVAISEDDMDVALVRIRIPVGDPHCGAAMEENDYDKDNDFISYQYSYVHPCSVYAKKETPTAAHRIKTIRFF